MEKNIYLQEEFQIYLSELFSSRKPTNSYLRLKFKLNFSKLSRCNKLNATEKFPTSMEF